MNKYFIIIFKKYSVLSALIFFSYVLPAISEPGISTFMYHRFGEDKYPSTSVNTDQFYSHIEYILNEKIKIISLDEIIQSIEKNDKFNEKAIAFSVDDAYSSFYEIAWPVFKKNNIPVTLFVSTDIIDKKTKGYMTWNEIKSFIEEGGSVGQHTSTHLHMPLNDTATIKKDILESHKSWVKNIGFIPKLFAYPYGESSEAVIDILKEFGISHGFGQHSGVISSFDNPYYLPRFSLNERFGMQDRFEFAVNSHSLDVIDFIPADMFLVSNRKPQIEFSILNDVNWKSINCFSNPGGQWNDMPLVNITSNRIQINLEESYETGRARLNCTTKINNKWHWFGYQFLVK